MVALLSSARIRSQSVYRCRAAIIGLSAIQPPLFTTLRLSHSIPPAPRSQRTRLLSLLAAGLSAGLGLATFAHAEESARDLTLVHSAVAKDEQRLHQPQYGTKQDYMTAIREIEGLYMARGLGDRVSTDVEDLETHGVSDWSHHEAARPTVVVWVTSTDEVVEVVKVAKKHRVPITPFSGGTSLEGHFSSVSV
jgi:D-lactate dehydrogenase (cytochrome)